MNTMLKKFVFVLLLAVAGVQNAFAQTSVCRGTVYFKAPDDWTGAYIGGYNASTLQKMKLGANGYYEYDLAELGIRYELVFAIGSQSSYNGVLTVTQRGFNVPPLQSFDPNWAMNEADIPCPGEGNTVYVYENPSKPGETVISKDPPNAKYFFVMIPPDMDEWMAAVPMLSIDGGVSGKPMTAVPDMCGWYSYVFWNEEPTDNVVLYRDDAGIDPVTGLREDMIGMNGNWETEPNASPIYLNMLFELSHNPANMSDTVFFVPDEEQKMNDDGFYFNRAEVDEIEGTCTYSLAAVLYDTDPSLHPSFSCFVDGGQGMNNYLGDCQQGAQGVSAAVAREYVLNCIGVTPGLVESTLDPKTKKPKMSAAGATCFMQEKFFDQLFNYTEGVNEKSCYDMPFKRSADGRWEFDSDYDGNEGGVQGGFAPLEYTGMTSAQVDAMVIAAGSAPLPAARTRHAAQGPAALYSWLREVDPSEGVPIFDLMCNGPGWDGGLDCATHFAGGDDFNGSIYRGTKIGDYSYIYCWGDYCMSEVPSDWPTFIRESETPVARTAKNATPRWESGNYASGNASGALGRNQHFCFESHAKFKYKPGLRFSFRGDDDIWVYIDNKLAVDLGGTHLAAPAYVNLDKFEGLSGKLEVGKPYDIDIFFCDRRSTMSNVRIKTNMYIQQKTAIDLKKTVNEKGEATYNVCYTRTGDGSCAAALSNMADVDSACGSKITELGINVSYTLTEGKSLADPLETFDKPGVYKCGIDLTNITSPKIDVSKICMNAGRYSLYMNIDGKSERISTFRVAGSNVDVVYRDASVLNNNEEALGSIALQTTALGGELVPVYISNVEEPLAAGDPLEVFPQDVSGIVYTLSYSDAMDVYYKDDAGEFKLLTSGQKRMIGNSGIDTVYATVPMGNLTKPIQSFDIKVSGREHAMSISYYLPKFTFVSGPDPETAKQVKGQEPEADDSYEELWVGSVYDLYVAILKPDANGKYYFCQQECDGIKIHKGIETSPKIEFVSDTVAFENGVATISVRALKSYRWDIDSDFDNPATIAIEYNDNVGQSYSPMYFRESPVPYPVMADVFDVRGATPAQKFKIPEPYFSKNYEYLDGIADSVAIYFSRPIHQDSLPTKVCVLWDSASAEKYDPYGEGFSSSPKDDQTLCNALFKVNSENIDCSSKKNGYCSRVVTLGGAALSENVKTAGVGKVIAYSVFQDRGKTVKQGFVGSLTDRIAPVPLKAELYGMKNAKGEATGRDSLVLTLSEPVVLKTDSKKRVALGFYKSETDLYVTKEIESELDPSITTEGSLGKVRFVYNSKKLAPQAGDYVRLLAELDKVYWADEVVLNSKDTLRAKADADYHWNSPTAYNETVRLPSPWVPVVKVGESKDDDKKSEDGDDEDNEFAEPSFRIKMVGPFQFAIVMEESATALQKTYAVMDLQGRVVQQGRITSAETVVPTLNSGSYVVRIGLGMRRVNIR